MAIEQNILKVKQFIKNANKDTDHMTIKKSKISYLSASA